MKTIVQTLVRGVLGASAMLLAASLGWGSESSPGSKAASPAPKQAGSQVKNKNAKPGEPKLVEITGSRLRYRVKEGEQSTATALHVTVIDPQSAVNRGYASPLEVLMRTPSVFRGR